MSSETVICRVESVNVHENAVLVDAQHLTRPNVQYRNTPLMAGFNGLIAIPQPGQKVVVSLDNSGYEYIEGILTGPDEPDTSLKEGDFALTFDSNTKFSVTDDGSGGYNISLQASGDVDVDAQGGATVTTQDDVTITGGNNILIDAAGDATVKASGNILIGSSGVPVAKQNHTHDYEDTGDTDGGGTSPTTKTTDSPNESGTTTQIE